VSTCSSNYLFPAEVWAALPAGWSIRTATPAERLAAIAAMHVGRPPRTWDEARLARRLGRNGDGDGLALLRAGALPQAVELLFPAVEPMMVRAVRVVRSAATVLAEQGA
jgi:hypothetical protein